MERKQPKVFDADADRQFFWRLQGNRFQVPAKYGYDKYYEAFGDSDRFEFVLYKDRRHDYLFYSEAAWVYREQLNADYKSYVGEHGKEYNAETKAEFMSEYLDKKKCFEPDPVLMEQILEMFDRYCSETSALQDMRFRTEK